MSRPPHPRRFSRRFSARPAGARPPGVGLGTPGLCVLLLGCAQAYDLPKSAAEDAGTDAGLALDAHGPAGLDAASRPAPGDDPEVGEVPPGGCVPGLCLACDASGRVTLPEDDEACPSLQCSALDTYSLRTDGEGDAAVMICNLEVHVGAAKRCAAPGRCRAQAEAAACQPARPLERARTSGPCQSIQGCQGDTDPVVGPAPPGQPCGAAGLCRADGTCDETIADSCGAFAGTQVCDEGIHVNGDPYCDVVNTPGANCIATCVSFGGLCLAAFEASAEAPCAEGAPAGCVTAGASLRCRCRNPG